MKYEKWEGSPCCQCGEKASHGRCFLIGYQADWESCEKAPKLIMELNKRAKRDAEKEILSKKQGEK